MKQNTAETWRYYEAIGHSIVMLGLYEIKTSRNINRDDLIDYLEIIINPIFKYTFARFILS